MFEKPAGRLTAAIVLAFLFMATLAPSTLAAGAVVEEGRLVYNTYCYACHGANLINTGSNAPDLRKFPLGQKSRFTTVVAKGKGQGKMPAWGDILSPDQINLIWTYVKTRGKI